MAANNNKNFTNPFEKLFTGLGNFPTDSWNRNIAALNAANKIFFEYFQTVSKRNQQIAQEAFEDYTNAWRDLLTNKSPELHVSKHVDLAKQAFEKSVANCGELGEILNKSNREAMEILTRRTAEILDETKEQLKNLKKAA